MAGHNTLDVSKTHACSLLSDAGMRAMLNTRACGLRCGIHGKQQGLKALQTMHTIEIRCWHRALNAREHQWVTVGAKPWSG